MFKLKIVAIGSSSGIALPKEVLAQLGVSNGGYLFLTESPDGFHLTPYSPEFEQEMSLARKEMRERRNALRELAGS